MKHLFFLIVSSLIISNTFSQNSIGKTTAQELNSRISNLDTIYIVNYWSTTCIPCLRELPYFERLQEKYKDKPVKVILLSFDFPEDYPEKLTNWVTKKKLKCEVIWFEEQKPNSYIPILNNNWEGSLPATTITHKKNNVYWFKEGIITEQELDNKIADILK